MSGPNASESGRFVILWHQIENMPGRQNHYDLMLEATDFFVTLELSDLPWKATEVQATVLPPHRLEYWELEGPISKNRGCVTRITRGEYQRVAMAQGSWQLTLRSAEIDIALTIRSETSADFTQLTPGTRVMIKS